MPIIDVGLAEESQTRYLTYALSVVSSRALPDVRDGLKPVQRRILYAMLYDLRLSPDRHFRKSAAVVGEVLARYHPHGDTACYDAMVRMAQDFSLRYPLVEGQGNFGSLDGDSAAAYRYTEAKLTEIAVEVIGDIGQETVSERDNFDQTVKEPVVLPSRVPNLLMNGSSGIAVGMATAIPPHNLSEVIKALLLLIEDEEVSEKKILGAIKGPDFPTGCLILNSKAEFAEIYRTGRGPVRMRASYEIEQSTGRGSKKNVVITSIPYAVDKSVLVEKIADLIIARKVPQLQDIRDESTDVVRIVIELTPGADHEQALAYLYKNTPLQQNFNVNLTALIPTKNPFAGRPKLLSLREMLEQFIDFRIKVTRCKLEFEKRKLEERIHLLEGLEAILDVLDEVIKIVRKSDGRADATAKLMKRFELSEKQAHFIVDLRIYQLSRTNVEEVTTELAEKRKRVTQIQKILNSKKALKGEVAKDLTRVADLYGDARRSLVISDFAEPEYDKEDFVQHEEAFAIVTTDGWLKRIRTTNDPESTRIREGDRLFFAGKGSTKDTLVLFTNRGNTFGLQLLDLSSTTGFGEPVQKMFRFKDGEQIVSCLLIPEEEPLRRQLPQEVVLYTERGYGFRYELELLGVTNKNGKRVVRVGSEDQLKGVCGVNNKFLFALSEQGYGVMFDLQDVPLLRNGGKGVILQKMTGGDTLTAVCSVNKKDKLKVAVTKGNPRDVAISELKVSSRAKRGLKVIKRGAPVISILESKTSKVKGSSGGAQNLSLF